MAIALQTVWPGHIPDDLWRFEALRPEAAPLFPLMGVSIDSGFLVAFAVGLLVILVFGWRRFDELSYDRATYSYRVIKEMAPRELRGSGTMRRSYGLYALGLVAIFTTLTFFGELILTFSAPALDLAGVKPDFSGVNFDTYEWPLLLAFGFAGFTPLLPPLVAFESWLRRRAHKAVGLPVRISERTAELLDRLDPSRAEDAPDDLGPGNLQTWVRTHIMETDSLPAVFKLRDDLELLLRWSNARGGLWPREDVRRELERLEREEAAEAAAALQEFEEIITRNYDESPPSSLVRKSRTESDPLQAHRKVLETNLTASITRMRRLRGEMAAVLAVYAERDTDYENIRQPYLRELLAETFHSDDVGSGPERGLLLMLPFVFLTYAVAIALDFHSLIGALKPTLMTVLVSAGMETARWFILLVLPALVAFSVRHILMDSVRTFWAPLGGEAHGMRSLTQWFWMLALTLAVGTVAISALAAAWVGLVSTNPSAARETLFEAQIPFYWFFVSQLVFVPVHLTFMLLAADLPADRPGANRVWLTLFSLLNAVALTSLIYFHIAYWFQPFGGIYCPPAEWPARFGLSLWLPSKLCLNIVGGTDFLLYGLAALFAAGPFIGRAAPAPEQGGADAEASAAGRGSRGAGTAAALLAGVVLIGAARPAAAQSLAPDGPLITRPGPSAEAGAFEENSEPILVGFRKDAEPFAYEVTLDEESRFVGYLADLCYDVFAGSRYRVISVPITARNRFELLRRPGDPDYDPGRPPRTGGFDPIAPRDADGNLAGHQPVDVLCDPTTIRFSRPEQIVDGLFSPIVFVSGVSYMRRTREGAARGNVYLAYVANTTAAEVALRACQANTFRIDQFSAAACPRDAPATVARAEAADRENGLVSSLADCIADEAGGSSDIGRVAGRYRLCIADSHTEVIRWFCAQGGEALEERVYFGDRDIILGKLEAWQQEGRGCGAVDRAVQRQQQSFTYEPYALVVSRDRPELFQHVQQRVYEFFSHRAGARSLFATYFPGQTMSDPLAYLFLLNAVSQESLFRYSRIGTGSLPAD